MRISRISLACLCAALFALAVILFGGPAAAQAPAAGPVQPWGLPPLPAGVGPVEKTNSLTASSASSSF